MIKLELTDEEAEWLQAVLGLVMQIARKWDNLERNPATDYGARIKNELSVAQMIATGEKPIGFIDSYGQARTFGHPQK